jgi:hypothetical protein
MTHRLKKGCNQRKSFPIDRADAVVIQSNLVLLAVVTKITFKSFSTRKF